MTRRTPKSASSAATIAEDVPSSSPPTSAEVPTGETKKKTRTKKEKDPLPPPRQWTTASNAEFYAALAHDLGAETGRAGLPDASPISTPLRWFNAATDWGGLAGATMTQLTGPSGEGKTALLMAFIRGILDLGGVAAYCDNENATFDYRFFEAMIGRELDATPNLWFAPKEVRSVFEEQFRWFDKFIGVCAKLARDPAYPGSILAIDSLDNLIPKSVIYDALRAMEEAADTVADTQEETAGRGRRGRSGGGKPKKDGIDAGFAGNIAMRVAGLIRPMLGRLVATAGLAKCHIVIISHETVEEIKRGNVVVKREPKARGGKAPKYFSSLQVRVTKRYQDDNWSEHMFEISKKRSGAVERTGQGGRFYLSTGRGSSPLGIDFAREAVEFGSQTGVLVEDGSHRFYLGDRFVGHGVENAVAALNADPELLNEVIARIDRWELATRGQPRRAVQVTETAQVAEVADVKGA